MPENINTIIIDDEKLGREIVKNYLSSYPGVYISAECSNGFEGLKKISELKPDLIFLDIQMPKITGFEMLELIDEPPVIIFTTAYDQFALRAFEVNAADYLLKPFSKERFDEALKKALIHLKDKTAQSSLVKNLIAEKEKQNEYLERIVIKDGSKIFITPVEAVRYIEAQDDYVKIFSNEGNHLKQKTMKYFETHLNPDDFIRIHRSYIAAVISIKNLELFEKETYRVTLKDGTQLPVSKSGYDKLKELLH
ncbi:MAG: LytTR family transcriptional regulator DNA-binding domain-containing protein [Ignavibacteriaceae bacterium]|nr:LytTR family transcriptional regulator DNA-binding domain-containing protein [Ignavibacteriaceae bacterium]